MNKPAVSRKFRVPISFVNRRQDACKNALLSCFVPSRLLLLLGHDEHRDSSRDLTVSLVESRIWSAVWGSGQVTGACQANLGLIRDRSGVLLLLAVAWAIPHESSFCTRGPDPIATAPYCSILFVVARISLLLDSLGAVSWGRMFAGPAIGRRPNIYENPCTSSTLWRWISHWAQNCKISVERSHLMLELFSFCLWCFLIFSFRMSTLINKLSFSTAFIRHCDYFLIYMSKSFAYAAFHALY